MKYRKRKQWMRKNKIVLKKILFVCLIFVGIVLSILGFVKIINIFFEGESFEEIISEDALYVMSFNTDAQSKNEKGRNFETQAYDQMLENFEKQFNLPITKDVLNAFDSEIFLIGFLENETVLALTYKNKEGIKDMMAQYGTFNENKDNEIEFFTPYAAYSIAMVFYQDILLVSNTKEDLSRAINVKKPLQNNGLYQAFKKGISHNFFSIYLNTAELLEKQTSYTITKNYPLLKTLTNIFPSFGFGVSLSEKGMNGEGMLFKTDSFQFQEKEKNKHRITKFVPKDILFFWNGMDARAEYEQIEKFILQESPQGELVLESLWKDVEDWFGEGSKEILLNLLDSEYGLLLQDSEIGADIVFSFVSDQFLESNESNMRKNIQIAQSYLSPKIEIETGIDGVERERLVAQDSEDVLIKTQEIENGFSYETVEESILQKIKLSFSFFNSFFMISSWDDGMREFFSVYGESEGNIFENQDFLEYTNSFSQKFKEFGFINLSKLKHIPYFMSQQNFEGLEESKDTLLTLLTDDFRNITIGKSLEDDGVYFRTQLLYGK